MNKSQIELQQEHLLSIAESLEGIAYLLAFTPPGECPTKQLSTLVMHFSEQVKNRSNTSLTLLNQ